MKKRESNFLGVQIVTGQQGIVLNEKRGGLDELLGEGGVWVFFPTQSKLRRRIHPLAAQG